MILMHALFPLSRWERGRVRGIKSTCQAVKPITPRPLPLGEGAKATSTANLKFIVIQH